MIAILRRELGAYFSSPIGYVFLAAIYIFAGFFFFSTAVLYNSPDLRMTFSNLFLVVMVLIPLLTMRLLSEDKKHKTDQLLLTAPVSLISLVCGKVLAAFVVYLAGIAVTLLFAFTTALFVTPEWAVMLGHFVGLALLGLAMITIGTFISATTENQVVAAVGAFVASLFLMLIDTFAPLIPVSWLSSFVADLSFLSHYNSFTLGVLKLPDILFFISVCVVFLFLTVRVFEKRRWG